MFDSAYTISWESDFYHTGKYSISILWKKIIFRCFHLLLSLLLLAWILNVSWKQGYASPNSDRRDKALTRKRLEYFDCVSQYHDIPESDRPDDEINMLRQVTSFIFFFTLIHHALFLHFIFSDFFSSRSLLIVHEPSQKSPFFNKTKFKNH